MIWVCGEGASQEPFWVNESLEYVTPGDDVVALEDEDWIGVAPLQLYDEMTQNLFHAVWQRRALFGWMVVRWASHVNMR